MIKSTIQKSIFHLRNIRVNFLDLISPITSLAAMIIYRGYWVSHIASRTIRKWESLARKRERITDLWDSIHEPGNWWKAILLSLSIVALPQLLGVIWFYSPFTAQLKGNGRQLTDSIALLGTAWQVTAGLIGITFVIIIFLVEYANRNKYEGRALTIFFVETRMLFTASFGIWVIVSMGLSTNLLSLTNLRTDYLSFNLIWQWILFLINTVLILTIFIRSVQILPQSGFITKVKRYNHRIATHSVELELIDRLAGTISTDYFKEAGINFPYFEPDPLLGKVIVSMHNLPSHVQRVSDVNIRLVKIAFQHARYISPSIKESDFVFFAKIDHRIASKKPGIAQLSPILNHPSITKYLERSLKVENVSRRAKTLLTEELILNRDMLLHAVQNQESDTVEILLNHYLDLIEAFLQAARSYGIRFTRDSASKEMGLFTDWKLVSTILDQYISMVPSFLKLYDFEIISHFLSFPVNLMGLAVQYGDHLIYQQFSRLYPLIYSKCIEIQDPTQRERVINYCVHLLINHRRFLLTPLIEKMGWNAEQFADNKDYFIELLIVWNVMLKKAIDNRSSDRFSEFADETNNIIEDYFPNTDEAQIMLLENNLEYTTDVYYRNDALIEIQRTKTILEFRTELDKFRQRMFFGLGGWLIHLLDKGKISENDYFSLIPTVDQFFIDIDEFYDDYINDFGEEKEEHLFGWDSWEMNEWPTLYGKASSGWLNYQSWLEKYFIIRSIIILPNKDSFIPQLKTFSRSTDVYESIKGKYYEILKEQVWMNVFQRTNIDGVKDRIGRLLEMLKEASDTQIKIGEEEMINAVLDADLIKSFREQLINGWMKEAHIRQIVTKRGRYKEVFNDEIIKTTPYWGFSELVPKGVFVKQNRVTYLDFGSSYGRGLARTENSLLGSQFVCGHSFEVLGNKLSKELMDQINIMRKSDLDPIIFVSGKEVLRIITRTEQFTPGWRVEINPLEDTPIIGLFAGYPTVQNNGIPENSVCLIDIGHFGVLTQYKVSIDSTSPINLNINEVGTEEAGKIIEKNPKWYEDSKTEELLSQDAAIRRVQQNVEINIHEYCRFEEINPQAVRLLNLRTEKSEEAILPDHLIESN